MNILFKAPLRKNLKKQSRPFQLAIEDEVERVIENPGAGKPKKGDLAEFRIHKFTFQKQKYLLAYKTENKEITFHMIDTHDNFYRNLKQHLKGVE